MKKKRKKRKTSDKILSRVESLREIFKDRTNVIWGLTKDEVIHMYNNIPMKKVLNLSRTERDKIWEEIYKAKKYLRKEKVMAIISIYMPKGTVLENGELGKRMLKQSGHVYFRCVDREDALIVKTKFEKIAKGLVKAGHEITKITETNIQEVPVFEELKEAYRDYR